MINNNEHFFATLKEESPAPSFLIAPEQPYSVPQLIQAPILNLSPGRQPIRLITYEILQGVNGILHQLHVLGFAEVLESAPSFDDKILLSLYF